MDIMSHKSSYVATCMFICMCDSASSSLYPINRFLNGFMFVYIEQREGGVDGENEEGSDRIG